MCSCVLVHVHVCVTITQLYSCVFILLKKIPACICVFVCTCKPSNICNPSKLYVYVCVCVSESEKKHSSFNSNTQSLKAAFPASQDESCMIICPVCVCVYV